MTKPRFLLALESRALSSVAGNTKPAAIEIDYNQSDQFGPKWNFRIAWGIPT